MRERLRGNQNFTVPFLCHWLIYTQMSINRVAIILEMGMGDKEAALPLFEENLRLSRRTYGSEHPSTLNAIACVGMAYCQLQRHGEGLPLLREAAAGFRKVHGEGDPKTQHLIGVLQTGEKFAAAAGKEPEEAASCS